MDTIRTVNVTRADGLCSMFECLATTTYLVRQLTGEMKWDYSSYDVSLKVLGHVRYYALAYSFSYRNTETTRFLYTYFYEKNPVVKFEMELMHKKLVTVHR